MKTNKFFFKIIPLVLILAVVITPAVAVGVSAATSSVDYSEYDLSKSGSHNNVELGVADFIEMIDGTLPVSELEKDYLLEYSYINVKYDEPTSQYVTVTAKDDAVTISALPYSYTSANKTTVSWYPVSAKIAGTETVVSLQKSENEYVGVISGVEIDSSTTVQVEYKIDYEFVIAKDDINGALNAAYNQGAAMKGEYDSAKAAYDAAMLEYEAYLERQENIDAEIAKYEQYLEDYAYYLEDLSYYNEYLEEVAEYEQKLAKYQEYQEKLAAYNAYRAYVNNYISYLDAYEADLEKYNEYLEKMEKVKAQLDLLDTGLYAKVTYLQRDLYSCMFAGLVDQVVENRDLFVSGAGANPNAIDGANSATTNIRKMLNEYKSLTEEADKYGFYISNYEAMRDNIALLATCLYDLYLNDMIRVGMHSQEKTEKYVIMVSQLVLFANALSDTGFNVVLPDKYGNNVTYNLDKTDTITYLKGTQQPYGEVTKTMLQILEDNEYVLDLNIATPLDSGYPQEVAEPVKPVDPSELEPVKKPSYVQCPTAPDVVACPVEPEEVTDPRTESMDEPIKDPVLDNAEYVAMAEAINSGVIAERAEVDEDYVYVPTTTLEKSVISAENVSVIFYDTDRTTVLSRIITGRYSTVEYSGKEPVKADTDSFAFYFNGWVDADGNTVDLSEVENDVNLYPDFIAVPYLYIAFYATDGVTVLYTDKILLGQNASYGGEAPVKESVPEADYIFAGWIDGDGEAVDLTSVKSSLNLYPAFDTVRYAVVNFYGTDGSTVIHSERVKIGEAVSFIGEEPVKDSDPETDYVFSGWSDENGNSYNLDSADASADLYPVFDEIKYAVINFYGTDRVSIIATERVKLGDKIVFNGTLPTKDPKPEAGYVFSHWVDKNGASFELETATVSADLYPEFFVTDFIILNFYGTDGSLIKSERILKDVAYSFDGEIPFKDSDAETDYVFAGWIDSSGAKYDLSSPSSSADIYPCFDEIKYAVINFYDTDRVSIIATERVELGSEIIFNGTLPAKDPEPEAGYLFSHWADKDGNAIDLSLASASVDLYPEFEVTEFIVLSFYDTDGVTLLDYKRVLRGTSVSFDGETPVKALDSAGKYTFAYWVDETGAKYALGAAGSSANLYPYFDITPYITVTFYAADGVTVLDTATVLLGDGVSYNGVTPTKAAEPEAEYSFSGWMDSYGNAYDLTVTEGSVSLYPAFDVTAYAVVNFYDTDGVTVVYSVRTVVGGAVDFIGTLPVKAPDSDAIYTFDVWADAAGQQIDFTAVCASADLYPQFIPTYYIIITFYAADGMTVLCTDKVLPGEAASYNGETPVKDSEPEADYTFADRWLDADGNVYDLSAPASSVALYPDFKATRYIVVNFLAADGITALETLRVRPGGRIIYSGDTPVKEDDGTAVYAFSHWANSDGEKYEFEYLKSSADFYPVFTATPYLTVTFYAYDRASVLDVQRVLKGGTVSYDGPTPTKEGTSYSEFVFKCWLYDNGTKYADGDAVEASVALYPKFNEIPYVTVLFYDLNGTRLYTARVLLGGAAEFVGELPVKPSDVVADYVFEGSWAKADGTPYDITNVKGAAVLYPVFKPVYKEYELETDINGITQLKVDLTGESLDSIPVEHFLSVAAYNRAALLITTDTVSVRMAYSAVSAMAKADVTYITPTVTLTEKGCTCIVNMKTADGSELTTPVSLTVSFACDDVDFGTEAGVAYLDSDGTRCYVSKKYEGGVVSFNAKSGTAYEMLMMYDVSISVDIPIEVTVSVDKAEEGDTVTVTPVESILPGKVLKLYYFDSEGTMHEIVNNVFVMPDSYVTVGASVSDIIYTVTFMSDGKILAENKYKYGDTVAVPRDPTKQNDGIYSYTFDGWSEEISTVSRDVVYYAQFIATELPDDSVKGIQISDKYLKIIKIAIISVAAFVVLVVILIITKVRKAKGVLDGEIFSADIFEGGE